jgi:long-chain acyl-CoA synthetase
VTFGEYKWKTF